jgi:hypothetical protein
LGSYSWQTSQAPRRVGADVLAEVAQIVVKLAISIELATFLPSYFEHFGSPLIFQRSLGKRFAQSGIEAARMNQQHRHMALTAKISLFSAMISYLTRCPAVDVYIRERGDALAKYAVAFSKISRCSVTLARSRLRRRIPSACA